MKASAKSRGKPRLVQRQNLPGRSEVLREMLEQCRRRGRVELEILSRRLREEDRPEGWDEADQAAYGLSRELGSARVGQLIQMLRQIDEALTRHADGRYGRCAACEGEIPLARLRSLPFALYCRDCQEAEEVNGGRTAGALA
ncbi:MAG: TraR/DksA family transcriptional regulator [Candidatus Methylomirabilales bacterium]